MIASSKIPVPIRILWPAVMPRLETTFKTLSPARAIAVSEVVRAVTVAAVSLGTKFEVSLGAADDNAASPASRDSSGCNEVI